MPHPRSTDSARREEAKSLVRMEQCLPDEIVAVRRYVRDEYGHGRVPVEAKLRAALKFDIPYWLVLSYLQGRSVKNVLGL